ncbi:helix-turn-helix domain-containing protein [Flagellimonas sp.]|uniref:helix-turn-helix domain-containing protein n=1 Tax=Flagellimonas sp. TaxID=2058762 RepID=UPI003AB1EF05
MKVHVNYFNRVLKRHLGRTIAQIISDSVLKEAKRLLKETLWSITEIAFALGFSEPTHFSHFLKKWKVDHLSNIVGNDDLKRYFYYEKLNSRMKVDF